jgi:predicted lipid-binding transport protein (Tim44 family)
MQGSSALVEILFFAVVAGAVLFRLYQVLGKKTGAERPDPRPEPQARPTGRPVLRPVPNAPQEDEEIRPANEAPPSGASGLTAIGQADPAFTPQSFLKGAKAAYEMIVEAFGRGDEATLKGLLTPDVFEGYVAAIAQRTAENAPPIELVRLRSAEITEAELDGSVARVTVAYKAELAHGPDGLRETDERWTYERDTRGRDPNWFLSAVEAQ